MYRDIGECKQKKDNGQSCSKDDECLEACVYSICNGPLINHWPFDENLNDIISGKNFIDDLNLVPVEDRNGKSNSALHINHGKAKMPYGNYLSFGNSGFTIMIWIKILEYNDEYSILEIKQGYRIAKIGFNKRNIYFYIGYFSQKVSLTVTQGVCTHLAFTYEEIYSQQKIYKDAVLTEEGYTRFSFQDGENAVCEIGDSDNINVEIDDMKFFNRLLTPSEIELQKNLNE